jgi:hypothetical protein
VNVPITGSNRAAARRVHHLRIRGAGLAFHRVGVQQERQADAGHDQMKPAARAELELQLRLQPPGVIEPRILRLRGT